MSNQDNPDKIQIQGSKLSFHIGAEDTQEVAELDVECSSELGARKLYEVVKEIPYISRWDVQETVANTGEEVDSAIMEYLEECLPYMDVGRDITFNDMELNTQHAEYVGAALADINDPKAYQAALQVAKQLDAYDLDKDGAVKVVKAVGSEPNGELAKAFSDQNPQEVNALLLRMGVTSPDVDI